MKQKAAEYLKKASVPNNFAAEMQYGRCMLKVNKNFDYLKHLKNMSEKYNNQSAYKQKILLCIGFYLFHENESFIIALQYLLYGIECNPQNYEMFQVNSRLVINILCFSKKI